MDLGGLEWSDLNHDNLKWINATHEIHWWMAIEMIICKEINVSDLPLISNIISHQLDQIKYI